VRIGSDGRAPSWFVNTIRSLAFWDPRSRFRRGVTVATRFRLAYALSLLLLLGAGGFTLARRKFQRAFAPPQRATDATPTDFGLDYETVWLLSINSTQLHAWWPPYDWDRAGCHRPARLGRQLVSHAAVSTTHS